MPAIPEELRAAVEPTVSRLASISPLPGSTEGGTAAASGLLDAIGAAMSLFGSAPE